MKGLRLLWCNVLPLIVLLESSPVYEGIKTLELVLFVYSLLLESSPVYEGIKKLQDITIG